MILILRNRPFFVQLYEKHYLKERVYARDLVQCTWNMGASCICIIYIYIYFFHFKHREKVVMWERFKCENKQTPNIDGQMLGKNVHIVCNVRI